ncbi:hypothetical protein WN944_019512 [Citrus x changshan-huyou]|uniref:Uncharacterized protein n=1 Tax=Citrus x changshan-huyou TaxID=2935761 RepID=A0AAP0LW39_9ROSI
MIFIAWVQVAGFASRGFEWLVLGLLLATAEVASYIVAVCLPSFLEAAAAVISRGCWVRKSLLRCGWSCSCTQESRSKPSGGQSTQEPRP